MTPDESISPTAATKPKSRPRRRWWSLSIRSLMLLVLIVGGVIGWEMNRVNRIRRAVAVLVRNPDDPPDFRPTSETISLTIGDAPSRNSVTFATVQSPWIPDWLRATLGDEHFPRVVKLVLARSPSATDWDAIAALGSVRTLNLTYIPLKDADLALLPVCADLRELSLFGTGITDGAMASVGTLRNLRTLDLRMTKVTPGGLAPLANLTQLEELELSSGAGTDVGVGHLRGLTKLRTLGTDGFGSELSDVGLGYLKGMTQLEGLEFAARHVSDKGIAILAQLPRLRVLKIHAAFPHVSEAIALTARGVEQLGQFSSLERLDLDPETAIDDTWLRAIGRLVGLRQFQIAGAGITDAGLVHLQGLPNLEKLRIISPNVTDAGLVHLRPLARLVELGFYARVSDAGIAAIRPAFPALKRVYNTQRPDDSDPNGDLPTLLPAPPPPATFQFARPPQPVRPAP